MPQFEKRLHKMHRNLSSRGAAEGVQGTLMSVDSLMMVHICRRDTLTSVGWPVDGTYLYSVVLTGLMVIYSNPPLHKWQFSMKETWLKAMQQAVT